MEYIKKANVKYSYSRPKKNITGLRFNQLEALEWLGFKEVGSLKKRRSIYKCLCSCGNLCEVTQTDISSGNVKSCGCRMKEVKKIHYKGENWGSIGVILNNYKQSAKRHKRDFFLSRDEFVAIITSDCYYCGLRPNTEKKAPNTFDKSFLYNGIDRVDNLKGYTLENCVPCCTKCNFFKRDIHQEEFLEMIKNIYLWRIQSN